MHLSSGADYTSNSLLRTYPDGLDVEVIRSDALLDAAEQATNATERAGVTTFVHRRPAEYKLQAAAAAGDYEDHRWMVDGPSAADRLQGLLDMAGADLTKPWEHFLAYDRTPRSSQKITLRVARQNVLDALPELTDSIGYPPDPFPSGDPARRSWGVWYEEELIGAIAVSVQNGWGTLAGHFIPNLDDALADAVLDALDERLTADDQVMALTIDGSRIREYHS